MAVKAAGQILEEIAFVTKHQNLESLKSLCNYGNCDEGTAKRKKSRLVLKRKPTSTVSKPPSTPKNSSAIAYDNTHTTIIPKNYNLHTSKHPNGKCTDP